MGGIDEIIDEIKKFRDERDWEQFHSAKDLAISLTVESAELLEVFLWKNENEADIEKIKLELADVFYASFLLADKYNLDIFDIIKTKLELNRAKYPVEKSKGKNKKYDEF